jgi:hypothetical protein
MQCINLDRQRVALLDDIQHVLFVPPFVKVGHILTATWNLIHENGLKIQNIYHKNRMRLY